jgi:hypothetical protein
MKKKEENIYLNENINDNNNNVFNPNKTFGG